MLSATGLRWASHAVAHCLWTCKSPEAESSNPPNVGAHSQSGGLRVFDFANGLAEPIPRHSSVLLDKPHRLSLPLPRPSPVMSRRAGRKRKEDAPLIVSEDEQEERKDDKRSKVKDAAASSSSAAAVTGISRSVSAGCSPCCRLVVSPAAAASSSS